MSQNSGSGSMMFKEDMRKRRKRIFRLLMKRFTIDEIAAMTGWGRATICRDLKRYRELRKTKENYNKTEPTAEEIEEKDTDSNQPDSAEKLIGLCSKLGWW